MNAIRIFARGGMLGVFAWVVQDDNSWWAIAEGNPVGRFLSLVAPLLSETAPLFAETAKPRFGKRLFRAEQRNDQNKEKKDSEWRVHDDAACCG